MKHSLIYLFFLTLSVSFVNAQGTYLTKDGYISFFSHSLVEDIKADNHQVVSVLNSKTGEIGIQLLMRSFIFEKALMQEHFNENYIESHKHPKATFKGAIQNYQGFSVGKQEVLIKGVLTIRGIQKEIQTKAVLNNQKETIEVSGDFTVAVADFNIKIPTVVRNNIAKIIKVSFELKHKPYQ